MQVNSISQQSFRGLYIIKGTGRDVSKATYEICRRSSSPIMQRFLQDQAAQEGLVYKAKDLISELGSITYHSLTGYYGESQPLVQNIIATNNDCNIVDNFCEKFYSLEFLNEIDAFDSKSIKTLAQTLINIQEKENRDMARYEFANLKCNEGNPTPLTDFILEKAIQAKKTLANMLAPYGKKEKDIEFLEARTVLNALEQDMFDCVNGTYKEI